MAIQIGNQGTITISTNVTIDSAKSITVYTFQVYVNEDACPQNGDYTTIYSPSVELIIGSALYIDSELTIPTTYSTVGVSDRPGFYWILTGNIITSNPSCN
jgi:hypothetical protein